MTSARGWETDDCSQFVSIRVIRGQPLPVLLFSNLFQFVSFVDSLSLSLSFQIFSNSCPFVSFVDSPPFHEHSHLPRQQFIAFQRREQSRLHGVFDRHAGQGVLIDEVPGEGLEVEAQGSFRGRVGQGAPEISA